MTYQFLLHGLFARFWLINVHFDLSGLTGQIFRSLEKPVKLDFTVTHINDKNTDQK